MSTATDNGLTLITPGQKMMTHEELMRENATLKKALEWVLHHGVNVYDYNGGQPYSYQNSGCGCCSYGITVPDDIYPVVSEAARVVVEKKNEPR